MTRQEISKLAPGGLYDVKVSFDGGKTTQRRRVRFTGLRSINILNLHEVVTMEGLTHNGEDPDGKIELIWVSPEDVKTATRLRMNLKYGELEKDPTNTGTPFYPGGN